MAALSRVEDKKRPAVEADLGEAVFSIWKRTVAKCAMEELS
jgi:hypothetical protein